MFWKRANRETPQENIPEQEAERPPEPITLERDAQRPATILRVAGGFEERGAKILELFKEVRSSDGSSAVIPIHLLRGDHELLVEVTTRPWTRDSTESALRNAAVVRGSEYAGNELEILSAYPVPREVEFFFGTSPAALFQLDLLTGSLDNPEMCAEAFRQAASRHWGVDVAYDIGSLPLTEELLTSSLDAEISEDGAPPPILDRLAESLGCFVGEVIRHEAPTSGSWRPAAEWGDGKILEFDELSADPVGQARAFLQEGQDDSVAFYAEYVLGELREAASKTGD